MLDKKTHFPIFIFFFFPSKAPWEEEKTTLPLKYYAQHARQVGPMKKIRSKREMFEQIAKDIFDVLEIYPTGVQRETRYKILAKG